jgi:hypothetical protein
MVAEAVDWIRHAEWQFKRGNVDGGLHAAYTAIDFCHEARDRLVELLVWQDDAQGLAVSS